MNHRKTTSVIHPQLVQGVLIMNDHATLHVRLSWRGRLDPLSGRSRQSARAMELDLDGRCGFIKTNKANMDGTTHSSLFIWDVYSYVWGVIVCYIVWSVYMKGNKFFSQKSQETGIYCPNSLLPWYVPSAKR